VLVSIIIPTLNDLKNLKKCVSSINSQTFNDYEVWIIDGNSQDGTKDFLKTLKDPFNWVSNIDNGIYDAMNKGISLSKGEWIFFLGGDDRLYEKSTLDKVFKNKSYKNVELLLGKIKYLQKEKSSYFFKRNNGVIKPSWSNKLWITNTLPHQGIFYNKKIFLKRKYSLEYKVLADYAFNLHLFNDGLTAQLIDPIIAICGTDGISKKFNWNLYKEEVLIKTKESYLILKPFFILISVTKFIVKKIII
jgi:glycosyltransferase involved in cell wall biosynthesis